MRDRALARHGIERPTYGEQWRAATTVGVRPVVISDKDELALQVDQ
ncbi:hypothetical protein NX784_08095 [Massilia pinisoli]|uniref:Uncharacterized protein n=1 Tax=Massilia pinisoli TaxID=1772194 RepID=A0ABT1ZNT0_9BURK|nr:hypothetical protein [Massilia pinisoli]MCS0581550.1 hypothetical protein [Massilia pinisoli]